MKNLLISLALCLPAAQLFCQGTRGNFVTSDIDHFWTAYDKIITTKDSAQQYDYLNRLFIAKGTPGLTAMMQAKRYTLKSYIDAINKYPLFWKSIRSNTLKAKNYAREIELAVNKLAKIYPVKAAAELYFTIGALRSNGTTMNNKVLIGSELAMADENTIVAELAGDFSYLPAFFKNNPVKHIVFLNMHEYVHTQQKTSGGYDLLSQCLYEGIAEFVPVVAMQKPSPTPAVGYGTKNNQRVKAVFSQEMFSPWFYNWIWNDFDNEFKIRDQW